MTDINLKCMKCGSSVDNKSRYCSGCGSNMAFQKKLSKKRFKISWRWVLFSLITIFIFEYIFAGIAGQIYLFFSGAEFIEIETSIAVSSVGTKIGIFLGSLYSFWISPGITIKEPVLGAAAEIIISQSLLLIVAGIFTPMVLIGISINMIVAFAGVKTGEIIQKKLRRE